MNWYSPVGADIEQRIFDLRVRQCHFVWKDINDFSYLSPEAAGEYTFEIWKNEQRLDYIDKLQHPLNIDAIARVEIAITRQWILHQSYR